MLNLNTFELRSNNASHRLGVYVFHIEDDLFGEEIVRIVFPLAYDGTLFTRTAAIVKFYEGKGPVVANLVRYYKNKVNLNMPAKLRNGSVSDSMRESNPGTNFNKYIQCLLRELG